MKLLLMLPSLAFTVMACAAAFILTSAIDLPSAADIGIWVIAACYSIIALFFGLIAMAASEDF